MVTGLKSLTATIPMTTAVLYVCSFTDWSLVGHKMLKCGVLGGAIVAGVVIYMVGVRLLRCEEAVATLSMLQKKIGRA
jgi:hypothetical protein